MTDKKLFTVLQILCDNRDRILDPQSIANILNGELSDQDRTLCLNYIVDNNLIITQFQINEHDILRYNELKKQFDLELKDEKIIRDKLYHDAKISKWTANLLLPTFILAIIGAGYSIFDIVLKLSTKPNGSTLNEKYIERPNDTITGKEKYPILDTLGKPTDNPV